MSDVTCPHGYPEKWRRHCAQCLYDETMRDLYEENLRLRTELATLTRETLGYQAALRDIDTHIRGTHEPVPYIVETLKTALPEYDEEDGGDTFE